MSRGLRPPTTLPRQRIIHLPFLPCNRSPSSRRACQHHLRKSNVPLLRRSLNQRQFTNLRLERWRSMRIMMIAATRRILRRSKKVEGILQSRQMVWLLLRRLMVILSNRIDEEMFDAGRRNYEG